MLADLKAGWLGAVRLEKPVAAWAEAGPFLMNREIPATDVQAGPLVRLPLSRSLLRPWPGLSWAQGVSCIWCFSGEEFACVGH